MSEEIRVSVVEFGDRKCYQLQYRDPVTKRKKTKSSGIPRTGRRTERAEAEKAAGKLQAELRDGRYRLPSKITWEEFRNRHQAEVQPTLAAETCKKLDTTFDLVERILAPLRLQELTADRLSKWVAQLQKEGRAPTTAGIYCRHLRSALSWAVDMGFIHDRPKIRIPRKAKGEKLMKGRPIVLEEHERMIVAVEKVIPLPHVAAWQRFLSALWWSGLRLGEALELSWDSSAPVSVLMQPGYYPVLKFQAGGQKAKRAEIVPAAPEFCEMLEEIPEEQRTGRLFRLHNHASRGGGFPKNGSVG